MTHLDHPKDALWTIVHILNTYLVPFLQQARGCAHCSHRERCQPQQDRWLDNADIMRMFNIGRSKLYGLRHEGVLKPHRLGKKVYYLESEVRRSMKA